PGLPPRRGIDGGLGHHGAPHARAPQVGVDIAPAGGRGSGAVSGPSPSEVDAPIGDLDDVTDEPWIVLVWNDPVNLMSYVTYVFQKLFGYSLEKATELMLDVHHKGRAVVSSGTREKAELDVSRLHEHGLWATMQKDD